MFRKKKSDEPKYYKTMGWHWEYLLFWPMGWSMRAVTEYDPNDTFQLFCHDIYGVHPRFTGGWPSAVYFSPAICAVLLLGIQKYATFLAIFIPGWALFTLFANWYFTTHERNKYE